MKSNLIAVIIFLSLNTLIQAQSPYAFNWQSVIRDNKSRPLGNRSVEIKFGIYKVGFTEPDYSETHVSTTNALGLISLVVGQGSSQLGDIKKLHWGSQAYELEVMIDGEKLPRSPILSSPLSLYAIQSGGTSDSTWNRLNSQIISGKGNVGIGITDPKYKLSVAGQGAFANRVYVGLNGTENGYSLLHFKNGTDKNGGLIRASQKDDDSATAPLEYQGTRHKFIGGSMVLSTPWPALHFVSDSGPSLYWEMTDKGQMYLFDPSLQKYRMSFNPNGRVGIGTTEPISDLHVNGSTATNSLFLSAKFPALHFASNSGKILYWEMTDSGLMYLFDPSLKKYRISFNPNGRVGIGTTEPTSELQVNGTTTTNSLIILGNDRAELFLTVKGEKLPHGAVAVFDETQPGKIGLSTHAYDKKRVGVITHSTGKYRTGILHAQNEMQGGEPVALEGMVEVLAVGPLSVGDDLTTSNIPGYAMRVDKRLKSIGAVIGKAAQSLAKGEKGIIEMRVELR